MIARFLARVVEFARRRAAFVLAVSLLLSIASGLYAATHLKIDTDINHMLPSGLAWRQDELELDAAFPQNADLLVVVIDGQTGDLADRAAQ